MKSRILNLLIILGSALLVYILIAGLMYNGTISEYTGLIITFAGIYVIVALGSNLVTGITGQLALGQAGFMAVGGYSTALAAMKLNLPILPSIVAGGLVSAVFGILIGFPTLRLRGDYLAIATLGFGEIIGVIIVNLEDLTGGASGLKGIPSLSSTGDIILDEIAKFSWVYGFLICILIVIVNLMKSSTGRAIISIREDEIASNSMGVNVSFYKMLSFTVSSFIAGIGGGLYAYYIGYLSPDMFNFMLSVNFVVIIVLGGLGSITGTIISGIFFVMVQQFLKDILKFNVEIFGRELVFDDLWLVLFGLALILVMLFRPKGLLGTAEFSITDFVNKLIKGEYKPSKLKNMFNSKRKEAS